MTTVSTVSVQVSTGGDAEETDRLARQFRQEALALDLESATLASSPDTPAGAKGDPIVIGTLIITLANSAVLRSLCQLASSWVTRDLRRRIVLKDKDKTLEITGANVAQHQQLIDAFLARTNRQSGTDLKGAP